MAKVNFIRKHTKAEVNDEPIVDGNFIVTGDGGTFIDYEEERVPINGTIVVKNGKTESDTDVYSCNYINNLNTYSTEEKRVGTWIDGKPLYRKTITFNTIIQMNKTTSITHNIENAKNIFIDFSASFMEANIGKSDYLSYNFPLIGYDGNITDKSYCYVDLTNINFYSNGGWGENWTKHITLNYTKTTD